jgi:uncharacterized protein YrrD
MKQLRRIHEVTDLALHAIDGEIGSIQEVYFDDRSWAVRYLIVKTGWLLGRLVLVAPVAVRGIDDASHTMRIDLTKEQIEHSPPIDAAKPISREYEIAYYRHFRWAPYWGSGPTPHLRSSQEVTGYDIDAKDGAIGHVEDLIVDDEDWAVRYLEVDTRNWLPGKKVLIHTSHIDHISFADRSVTVALPRQVIASAPPYTSSETITPDYEVQLFKHYGQAKAA